MAVAVSLAVWDLCVNSALQNCPSSHSAKPFHDTGRKETFQSERQVPVEKTIDICVSNVPLLSNYRLVSTQIYGFALCGSCYADSRSISYDGAKQALPSRCISRRSRCCARHCLGWYHLLLAVICDLEQQQNRGCNCWDSILPHGWKLGMFFENLITHRLSYSAT